MSRLRLVVAMAIGVAGSGSLGCDRGGEAELRVGSREAPDATLRTHMIEPSTPTAEGLAYLRAVAASHERADRATGEDRIRSLREGLAAPVPAGLPEAEVLRLDLAARLAEQLMARPGGARTARDVLSPMLTVRRSLPLDRATARALVVLGDAAAKTGDDALAAGSYARSIEVMSLLRQEIEP